LFSATFGVWKSIDTWSELSRDFFWKGIWLAASGSKSGHGLLIDSALLVASFFMLLDFARFICKTTPLFLENYDKGCENPVR
jgi:hypothetical protein